MPRWEPDARGRLLAAALDLYEDPGYDDTTAAQIAERAGLSERTFFRHFADKREVLFTGVIDEVILRSLADAPTDRAPLAVVVQALLAGAERLEEDRDQARRRQVLLARWPALRERELRKLDSLADSLVAALLRRGAEPTLAALVADMGLAVYRVAMARWTSDGTDEPLPDLVREIADQLPAALGRGQPVLRDRRRKG